MKDEIERVYCVSSGHSMKQVLCSSHVCVKKILHNITSNNTRLFFMFFSFFITKKPFLACFHAVFPNSLSVLANVNALMKTQYMEIFIL